MYQSSTYKICYYFLYCLEQFSETEISIHIYIYLYMTFLQKSVDLIATIKHLIISKRLFCFNII